MRRDLVSRCSFGVAAALLLSTAACGGDDTPETDPDACAVVGSTEADIELSFTKFDDSDMLVDLADGDSVSLVEPPQDGRVFFVGVKMRNLSPCEVQTTTTLTDPSGASGPLDTRFPDFAVEGDTITSLPDLKSVAHINCCPNLWADVDLHSSELTLNVELTDRDGRTASASIKVRPTCAVDDAFCACSCAADYETPAMCSGGT